MSGRALARGARPIDGARAHIRAEHLPRLYSGLAHAVFVSGAGLAIMAYAVARLERPTAAEWALVPAALLAANGVEYLAHRFPMHRRTALLGTLFDRHTLLHHAFFTHEEMEVDSTFDFFMVLFPPRVLLFFAAAFATPGTVVVRALISVNAGWIFLAAALGYFLSYEWLHLSYHLPARSTVGRARAIRFLREHHRLHHDPRQMTRVNFNVNWPIADALFGTLARDARAPRTTLEGERR